MTKKIDYKKHREFVEYVMMSSLPELKRLFNDPKTCVEHRAIIKTIWFAVRDGDGEFIFELMDCILGK